MLSTVKDVSIVIAGLVALITFVTGTYQFIRQSRMVRTDQFVQMRRRFLENPAFRDILNLLATDDPALAHCSVQDRRNLVGFLEEVGLMVKSDMIRPAVAHYMFGYYVRAIARSEHFWEGLDPHSEYWTVFREFAENLDRQKTTSTKALRF
jgi:hypothetical protein